MYRSQPTREPEGRDAPQDIEIWLAITLVFFVSVGRVGVAIANREIFGGEATVALLIVLAPIVALGSRFARRLGKAGE